ncbi:MAG: DsbA family oxidoreductase [Proteobacteria bacterium]|nr:DsbA family oxidoreductase [Pseudomonadota bacterium]MDA0992688.1 DsbA family oxidoreductase [Pseudomonadota bacterium]
MIGSGTGKMWRGVLPRPEATLQVDVIADLACPWSFLGKKRLDDALAAVHGPSNVTWYPFQINPEMPDHGMPLADYISAKFGDPEKLQPTLDGLVLAGKAQGIDFRFDRITHVPNTLNAHRLMNLAQQQSADTSLLAEKILYGFFALGLDISDREVLAELGAEAGLGATEVFTTLEDERSRQIVLSQEAEVRRFGVTGVPDFLINKKMFVIGPQRAEDLVNVFDRVMFGDESDLPGSPSLH